MSFDFDFTAEKLAACVRRNHHVAELYEAMCEVLPRYEITSVDRVAAFLAQCGHESADFTILQENLKYTAEQLHRVWPSRFPTVESAQPYNRNAEAIANKVYSGRMGNGDEASGEGWLYRGRGAIQLTGKSNYTAFANHIGQSLEQAVAYTETLAGAVESAAFFWHRNGLNALDDFGSGLSSFGMASVVPALPSLGRALDADYANLQFVVSAYLGGLALFQPLQGLLSDRFGRRPVLLGGFTLFALASLLASIETSLPGLVFARF